MVAGTRYTTQPEKNTPYTLSTTMKLLSLILVLTTVLHAAVASGPPSGPPSAFRVDGLMLGQ
jgi:hypothetical protein